MNEFTHFTSLPPEQEAAFIPFEQVQADTLKKGMTLGVIVGVAIGLVILVIAFTVPPAADPHAAPPAGSQTQKAEPGK